MARVSEIVPGMYLSDMTAALDEGVVCGPDGFHFTHIVNATNQCAPNRFADRPGIKYFNVDIADAADAEQEMLDAFASVADWLIAERLVDTNSRYLAKDAHILVHCMCGVSRSASLVVALLVRFQLKIEDTAAEKDTALSVWRYLQYVKAQRPVVQPNAGFLRALLKWQEVLATSGSALGTLPPNADEDRRAMMQMIETMGRSNNLYGGADVRPALDRLANGQESSWCSLL